MIKNVNIFTKCFLILFFIILIYIIYRSEIFWSGTQRNYYLKYFISCLIFIIICIFLPLIIKKKAEYVIIILISIIFALYFLEGYLIFKKFKLITNKKSFDNETPLELYNNLKKKDDNIVLVTYPLRSQLIEDNNFFYFSGIANKKTLHCQEGSGVSIYQSDRYGFNNPDEVWNNEEIEYLLVGDSFVHGSCVNRNYDISSRMRSYSKKNVLNLGYSGSGPLIQYAILREYLSPGVKKVLWVYFEGNDLIDLNLELKNKVLNLYLNDKSFLQNLKLKQDLIDDFNHNILNNIINEIKIKNNYIDFIKLHELRSLLFSLSPNQPLEILPQFKLIIKQANDLVVNNNSQLFFIYLPDKSRFDSLKFQDNKNKIKKIINELNIEFIDIDQDVFKKELAPHRLFPFGFGHYNKLGYQKVSLKIFEKTK